MPGFFEFKQFENWNIAQRSMQMQTEKCVLKFWPSKWPSKFEHENQKLKKMRLFQW